MKYNGIEYLFDIDKVTDIWISFADNIALNENKEISVNVMKANGKRKPISRDFPSGNKIVCILERVEDGLNYLNSYELKQDFTYNNACNGVQREHNKKFNNGLPILHKVPPKRDYGRYFCIMAEKGGTSHGGLTEKLSPFFHAKKQEVNAYGR